MSVNRLLLTFRSSDALRMHLNLVSVGILMVMVGSAFAGAMQQHQHQLDPGAGLARTEPSAVNEEISFQLHNIFNYDFVHHI